MATATLTRTDEEIHAHFIGEQVEFTRMFEQSALSKKMILNDGSLESTVDEAYNFWQQNR